MSGQRTAAQRERRTQQPSTWAAKRLAEAGVKEALVDCGRPQSDASFTEHQMKKGDL